MADMQTYGHSDIRRYLQHKMTPQEMHDFEKALMNDPFLADALEGFSAGDALLAEKHLSHIESELNGEKKKAKVVEMPLQKTLWWKVAAVVLVLVIGGVFTYSLFTKNTVEKSVAQQMVPEKATEMAIQTDSIGPVEKPLAKVDVFENKELLKNEKSASPVIQQLKRVAGRTMQPEELKASTATSSIMEKNEGSSAFMDRNADATAALSTPVHTDTFQPAIAAKTSASFPALPENEFKGRVVDDNNKALTGVTILVTNSNIGTISDSRGYFALKARDTVLQINAIASGYPSQNLMIKNNVPVKIVFSERTQSLSEVVATSIVQKSQQSNVERIKEKTANGAEPEGGWKNFEQYVIRQTDSLKASDNESRYNGNIEITFSIDKDGGPTDIRMPENVDSITAEKAIQILTNGPKWKSKKKDKKVTIIILFE